MILAAEISAWMRKYIHSFMRDVIIHSPLKFNVGD